MNESLEDSGPEDGLTTIEKAEKYSTAAIIRVSSFHTVDLVQSRLNYALQQPAQLAIGPYRSANRITYVNSTNSVSRGNA